MGSLVSSGASYVSFSSYLRLLSINSLNSCTGRPRHHPLVLLRVPRRWPDARRQLAPCEYGSLCAHLGERICSEQTRGIDTCCFHYSFRPSPAITVQQTPHPGHHFQSSTFIAHVYMYRSDYAISPTLADTSYPITPWSPTVGSILDPTLQ